jgi:hypothetical protein
VLLGEESKGLVLLLESRKDTESLELLRSESKGLVLDLRELLVLFGVSESKGLVLADCLELLGGSESKGLVEEGMGGDCLAGADCLVGVVLDLLGRAKRSARVRSSAGEFSLLLGRSDIDYSSMCVYK